MRILQVCGSYTGGGAGRIAYALHQGYLARGHESWLAVGLQEADAPGVVGIPALTRPVSMLRLARWLQRWLEGPGQRLRVAWRLRPFVDRLQTAIPRLKWRLGREDFDFPGSHDLLTLIPAPPDVLHLHNLHGGYFDLRTLPVYSARFPLAVTPHDEWMLTGHCAYSLECMRWRTGCGQCPHLDTPPSLGRDATLRNWKRKRRIYGATRLHVATPSQWLMDRVGQSMLGAVSTRVIHNGVDQSLFQRGDKQAARAALGFPSHENLVLYVASYARTNPYKDYATIERAMHHLGEQSGPAVRCLCVGEEGAPLQLGRVRMEFVGHQEGARRLTPYYQAADAFVHAAKADTFPTTILEAMSCALPVVATAVGGVVEQVIEGRTGYLVPLHDAGALAERVGALLEHRDVAEEMGHRAVVVARELYSLDLQVKRYLDWYDDIVRLARATP
jgi:glycosyltransferase involved in cell wall biosynthesis